MLQNILTIYTDGACHPQSGTGAWAAIVFDGHEEVVLQQIVENTTHQRMELTAAIETLTYTNNKDSKPTIIFLYTDSQYVVDLPARREKLEQRDFVTKKGSEVQNTDLVKAFFALLDQIPVTLYKVKAHQKQGDTPNHNRTVDKLVRKILRAHLKSKG